VIRLYRAAYSTNVERVALALGLKGLTAESVWITYDDRGVVEAVSGQPLVPVLDYDGQVLTESMDIVRELDRRHPEPPLYPQDRVAEIEDFVAWFNRSWKGPPNQIEAELRKPHPDGALIGELEHQMHQALDRFEHMLATAPYLFGDTLTAADVCAFPFLKFATLHDPDDDERFHMILRDRQRDGTRRPKLAAWIERVNALPRA
jgi:maleylacetoacetate isomerase/maleylpyruvate isomerase